MKKILAVIGAIGLTVSSTTVVTTSCFGWGEYRYIDPSFTTKIYDISRWGYPSPEHFEEFITDPTISNAKAIQMEPTVVDWEVIVTNDAVVVGLTWKNKGRDVSDGKRTALEFTLGWSKFAFTEQNLIDIASSAAEDVNKTIDNSMDVNKITTLFNEKLCETIINATTDVNAKKLLQKYPQLLALKSGVVIVDKVTGVPFEAIKEYTNIKISDFVPFVTLTNAQIEFCKNPVGPSFSLSKEELPKINLNQFTKFPNQEPLGEFNSQTSTQYDFINKINHFFSVAYWGIFGINNIYGKGTFENYKENDDFSLILSTGKKDSSNVIKIPGSTSTSNEKIHFEIKLKHI